MGAAPRIALDAMGGDVGPRVIVAGAALAHETTPAGHGLDAKDIALAKRFLAGVPATPR